MSFNIFDFFTKIKQQRSMEKKGFVGTRKLKKQEDILATRLDNSKVLSVIPLIATWLCCVLVLTVSPKQKFDIQLVEGQIAPETVYAQVPFSYEDVTKTNELKELIKRKVPISYKIDDRLNTSILHKFDRIIDEVSARALAIKRAKKYLPDANNPEATFVKLLSESVFENLYLLAENFEQKRKLRQYLELTLNNGVISNEELNKYSSNTKVQVIDNAGRIREAVKISTVKSPSEAAYSLASSVCEGYSLRNRDQFIRSYSELTKHLIVPNLIPYIEFTKERQVEAVKQVLPSMVEVNKGEVIIIKGTQVTNKDLIKLKAYINNLKGAGNSENIILKVANVVTISLLLMVLITVFIYKMHREVIYSAKKMWVMASIVMLTIILNQCSIILFVKLSPILEIPPSLVSLFIPIALTSLLLSVLIGFRIGLACGIFVSVVAGLQLNGSFYMLVTGLVISCITGVAVRDLTNYKSYFVKSFLSVLIILLFVNTSNFIQDTGSMSIALFLLSFFNALITAITALLLLFLYEAAFKVPTNMSLLLLCNYNLPLLKQLQLEAPGTYHHSLMVATLAEHAAQDIGANPIKARVGALYHDIGKVTKAQYFTENNMEQSKHEDLHPRMSTLVIQNHVKEGTDLAIKYKLPRVVIDAIQQHHGTDLVYYFFWRAREEASKLMESVPVEEREYRYPGPKPQSKEVAIISLADPCEAAARAMTKPNPARIEALLTDIFKKRFRDGQLDEADLTFGEMAKIKESFLKTLTTMMHTRIKYPKDEENDEDDLFLAAKKVSDTEEKVAKDVDNEGSGNSSSDNKQTTNS
jgi:putative nucleotidyltransferase with HDIG domain